MIIPFTQKINSKYFYAFIMPELMKCIGDTKEELILDLSACNFIVPDVYCDMLSFFRIIRKESRQIPRLILGNNAKLLKYFEHSNFALFTEQNTLFTLDQEVGVDSSKYIDNWSIRIGSRESEKEYRKKKIIEQKIQEATGKYRRIQFKPVEPDSVEEKQEKIRINSEVSDAVISLYSLVAKKGQLTDVKLPDMNELFSGFYELVENSFKHANDPKNFGCYYTFQTYWNSEFTFSCSDTGLGFYKAMMSKYIQGKAKPRIFTEDEYKKAAGHRLKNLVGIMEGLVFNFINGKAADYGYPFVFRKLILNNKGTIIIQNEDTLLVIDNAFIEEFFIVEGGVLKNYRKEKIRSIFSDIGVKNRLIGEKKLRLYNYCFPGVHVSVHIPMKKKADGSEEAK